MVGIDAHKSGGIDPGHRMDSIHLQKKAGGARDRSRKITRKMDFADYFSFGNPNRATFGNFLQHPRRPSGVRFLYSFIQSMGTPVSESTERNSNRQFGL